MNKIKLISLAALICVPAMLLTSCARRLTVEDNGGAYYDKKDDVKYYLASPCYEPITVGEDRYAKAGKNDFFEIEGLDPDKWLCRKDGAVYYAEGVKLPTLDEMDITYVDVTYESMTVGKIIDDGQIDELIETFTEGESYYYANVKADISWGVKFFDTRLGIAYSIVYLEYAEDYEVKNSEGEFVNCGRKFLYDVYSGRFVAAGDTLDEIVERYYKSLDDMTETTDGK